MINLPVNTKYSIDVTKTFKKDFKKIIKQGKSVDKFKEVVNKLANLEELELKYRNHNLTDDKRFKGCKECHIEPDWLLVYRYEDDRLVLLLIATGSHSDIFR